MSPENGGAVYDVESFFGGANARVNAVHQHVGVAIDARVPDNDTLAKRGGRVGKFIAKHRRTAINIAVLCVGFVLALAVYFFASLLFFGARFVLAALLHEFASLFSLRSSPQTVASRAVVNVMEPWRRVNDVYRASLLLRDIVAPSTDADFSYDRVKNARYGQWSLANTQGRYNFTFDSLEKTMATDITGRRLPCACFAEYGVPLNAISGIPDGSDVRYDVRIDGELCAETERIAVRSDILDAVKDVLIASADDAAATEAGLARLSTVCPKAVYDGISKESGKRRRTEVTGQALQCAKACALLFDPELLKFVN